jgi:hypothetical protein
MVENCTMRAPRDGLVVYVNQANGMGRIETQIEQGTTVRENQPIFNLPNPKNMQVKCKVNESKIALIKSGSPADVLIDAFPSRPLRGTVAEVNAIAATTNAALTDVKVYYAIIDLDTGGFDELRPGLSAQVSFLVNEPRRVTRVPLQAVRWVDHQAFAAVATPVDAVVSKPSSAWQWRTISLGQSDPSYVEVVSGLKPGEKVVARPDLLPAPTNSTRVADAGADTQARPRG